MIVVTKLHFFYGDRVVFINDGYDGRLQQHLKRMLGIHVPLAIGQILVGEQNLSNTLVKPREMTFIERHQSDLPNSSQGLLLRDRSGPFFATEARHAGGNRSGADDNDLLSLSVQGGKFTYQFLKPRPFNTLG